MILNSLEKKEKVQKPEKLKTKEKKLASTNSSYSSQIAKSPLISAKNISQRIKSQKEHIDHNMHDKINTNPISNIIMRKTNMNGIKKLNEYKPAIKKMIKLTDDSGTNIDLRLTF